jgi:putative ABC transport system permease protein
MFAAISTRVRALLQRRRVARELDDELQVHVAMETEVNIAQGMPPAEARRTALQHLGGIDQTKEAVRDVRALPLEDLWRDIRHALRSLSAAPGFATVGILSLALGIGANVAIFGVVDTVLLRPLPFFEPQRLVAFTASDSKTGAAYEIFGMPDIQDLRTEKDLFEGVAAYQASTAILRGDQTIERVKARQVSPEFFPVLGVRPHTGRWLASEDPTATVVIAHDFWRGRFGADPNVIDRTLQLGDTQHRIVGVMPPGFDFPARADMWIPLNIRPVMTQRGVRLLQAVGRLKPGTTAHEANTRLAAWSARLASDFPRSHASIQTRLLPLHDVVLGSRKLPLFVIFGAVVAILLIAVTNVAALTSVRGAQRRTELSTRVALGAGRRHIVRLMMAESAILAAAGGAAGLLVAYLTLRAVMPFIPAELPRVEHVAIDARVIVFAVVITAVTAVLSGLFPAREASRFDLHQAFKGVIGSGDGHAKSPLRSGLVTAQVAVTLVLVTVAALLLNSFVRLRMVDLGIDTENVVTFVLQGTAPAAEYARISDDVLARVQSHPDVRAAARSSVTPLRGFSIMGAFRVEGATEAVSVRAADDASLNMVSPEYFPTFRIPIVAGRAFGAADRAGAPDVVLINETLARRFFNGNGIGRRISIPGRADRYAEIVGIVRDVYQVSPGRPPRPEVYWPLAQSDERPSFFSVRTVGGSTRLTSDLPGLIRSVNGTFFPDRLATAEQLAGDAVAEERFRALLVSAYSGLAIVLATVGVYGVIAFTVARRGREIGLRLALGAQKSTIFRLIVRQGLAPCLRGLVLGTIASAVIADLMRGLLFEVSPWDPLTFAAAAAVVGLAGLLACALPARRAARLDPLVALRYE